VKVVESVVPYYEYLLADINPQDIETGAEEIPLLVVTIARAAHTPAEKRVACLESLIRTPVKADGALKWYVLMQSLREMAQRDPSLAGQPILATLTRRVFELALSAGLAPEAHAIGVMIAPTQITDELVDTLGRVATIPATIRVALDFLDHHPEVPKAATIRKQLSDKITDMEVTYVPASF